MAKRPRTGKPKPAKRKTTRKTRTKNKPSRATPKRKDHRKHNGAAGDPWHRKAKRRKAKAKLVPRAKPGVRPRR